MAPAGFDRWSRRGALAGLASVALSAGARAQTPAAAAAISSRTDIAVEIQSQVLNSFSRTSSTKQFGRLEFRGGLVLTSTEKAFGGWSGLTIEPDGKRFLAVSDDGHWLGGELTYAGGALRGIVQARMGAILASNGRELTRKRDADAEAIVLVEGTLTRGTVLIAFERNHRIGRYTIVDGVLQAPAGFLRMPPDAKQMKANRGIEAMTVMAGGPFKGSVIAFAERLSDPAGNHTGWLWINNEPKRLHLTEEGGFEITDIASLADGSLLVLERRFRWLEGVKMQLRLIGPREIGPGLVAKGEMLLSTDMTSEIDNMEGLAMHRGPRGETVLTMISDDNFNSFLQRTILLQFTLT